MGQVSPRPTPGSNRLWFTVIPMQRLLLLRHGESTWNVEHRWQGWLDPPLTPAGEAQAAARARTLAHDSFAPRVIYTSDLQRALRTAEIIAAHVEAPVIADAGFRERHGGEGQGHTGAEIDERGTEIRDVWLRQEPARAPGYEVAGLGQRAEVAVAGRVSGVW